jgi:hypothetical protein
LLTTSSPAGSVSGDKETASEERKSAARYGPHDSMGQGRKLGLLCGLALKVPDAEGALLAVLAGEFLNVLDEFLECLPSLPDSQFEYGPRWSRCRVPTWHRLSVPLRIEFTRM